MGCFWGQDQGGHSGTPALSSLVVESPGQDLCWCTMLYGATSLGMRQGAGIWGCELTLHPLVMRSLDQFFFSWVDLQGAGEGEGRALSCRDSEPGSRGRTRLGSALSPAAWISSWST